jgi:hypothetical protein
MKLTEQNSKNEAADARENTTNEPTAGCEIVMNEPADACEIVTTEPTADRENVTNEPTLAADVGLGSPTYMKAPEQNLTIEQALAAVSDGGRGIEVTAGMSDGDDNDFHEEVDRQKSAEWIRAGLARMVALRAETPRELNEESRREEQEGNAGRPSLGDWHKHGKPTHRSTPRAERTKPRTTETYAARTVGASAELVNAGSGLTIGAGPAQN